MNANICENEQEVEEVDPVERTDLLEIGRYVAKESVNDVVIGDNLSHEQRVARIAGARRDARAGERWWSHHIPSRASPARNSRAGKPRVKFLPATFGIGFACRPLLTILMNQLNKPIRERSV